MRTWSLLKQMNHDAQQNLYATSTLPNFVQIANALAEDDLVGLADAIDQAEGRGLGPHAARMRIVLAKRTGDHAQLERAKPVLERLRDQQFLRRLKVVATTRG